MLTQRAAGSFEPVDVRVQRVLDSFVAQSLGVIAVGLTFIVAHVAFTGDVGSTWAYAGAILSFLVLVAAVHLVVWCAVRRPSEAQEIKRELVAVQLKALRERELTPHRVERATHG